MPDFLLAHADKSVRVVNVKPAGKLAEPRTAEALAWPGRLIEGHGWHYEIWSGADPVLLANLRFPAGYRRPGLLPGQLLDDVLAAVRPGDTIGGVIRGMRRPVHPDPPCARTRALACSYDTTEATAATTASAVDHLMTRSTAFTAHHRPPVETPW